MARTPMVVAALLALGAGSYCAAEEYACTDDDALALYRRRIEPLLVEGANTSCNDCHLSGVDLGLFAQATPCGTMACMVERQLVDLEAPEKSLVLDWILRADPASPLITPEVVEAEHEAVLEWIEYNARCGAKVCEPTSGSACGDAPSLVDCLVPVASPGSGRRPWDDPGDCSDRTLELMFQETVYSWRGRCYPCHFSDTEGEPMDAPRWIKTGDCAIASLETMRGILREGYIDLAQADQSLLLLKPLAESAGGVEHGGGDKFYDQTDPAYIDFLAWIERYLQCKADP